jgi:hypothetical protein
MNDTSTVCKTVCQRLDKNPICDGTCLDGYLLTHRAPRGSNVICYTTLLRKRALICAFAALVASIDGGGK